MNMNIDAIILMISTMLIVTLFTVYFFYKILTIKEKHEESSTENIDNIT